MSYLIDNQESNKQQNKKIKQGYNHHNKTNIERLIKHFVKKKFGLYKNINKNEQSQIITMIRYDRNIIQSFGLLERFIINLKTNALIIQAFIMKEETFFVIKSKQNRIFIAKQIIKWLYTYQHSMIKINLHNGFVKIKLFQSKLFQKQLDDTYWRDIYIQARKNQSSNYKRIIKILVASNEIPNSLIQKYYQNYHYFYKERKYLNYITLNPYFQLSQSVANYFLLQKSYNQQQQALDYLKNNIRNQIFNYFTFSSLYLHQYGETKNQNEVDLTKIELKQKVNLKNQISMPYYGPTNYSLDNKYITNFIYVSNKSRQQLPFYHSRYSNIYEGIIKYHYASSNQNLRKQLKVQRNPVLSITKRVAIKIPKIDQINSQQKINHQRSIILKMKGGYNAFLPKYYLAFNQQFHNAVILDFFTQSSLRGYLIKNSNTISLWTKLNFIFFAVQGLRFIRSYNIVHLDFKPTNIMLSKNMVSKIIDFGESFHPEVCDQQFEPGYTIPYSAPEIFSRVNFQRYSQKQDVFSLGVMIFESIFSKYPFFGDYWSLVNRYLKGSFEKCVMTCCQQIQNYGELRIIITLYYLALRCLDTNPKNRPYLDWIALILRQCLNYYRDT